MGSKVKTKRKSKYGRKRQRQSRLRKAAKLLALAVLAAAGGAGYEYYRTGEFTYTEKTVKNLAESAQDLAGWAGELPGAVQDLAGRAGDLPGTAQGLASWAGELPDAAHELLTKVSESIGGLQAGKTVQNVSSLAEIPLYTGETYVTVNDNKPVFTEEQQNAEPYEFYSEPDWLGRCGYAEAKISEELMPTEERGSIGTVKPSGWHTVKYDCIEERYLYNRCHLIGYQLTGENANEKNLITGTRYLNVEGMLPWENQVADYIRTTGDAVLYRVTPIFEGNNLVASGVEMEAQSVGSEKIRFHIYVFNVQPGVVIDYATGESWEES